MFIAAEPKYQQLCRHQDSCSRSRQSAQNDPADCSLITLTVLSEHASQACTSGLSQDKQYF